MIKNNNSKKKSLEKLRAILDNINDNELHPDDEKHLKSLRKRLFISPKKNVVRIYEEADDKKEVDTDLLKPRVKIILEEKEEKSSKKIEEFRPVEEFKKEETVEIIEVFKPVEDIDNKVEVDDKIEVFEPVENIDEEKDESLFEDEELFEVEKIKEKVPEFIEVNIDSKDNKEFEIIETSKKSIDVDIKKDKIIKEYEIADEELPEWKPIEEIEEKKEIKDKSVEKKGNIQSFEEKVELLPLPKVESKVELITGPELGDIQYKIEPFKELPTIDEKTAILLYDNGVTNIESLQQTPIKNLTKIKGVKKRQIKKIKKELDLKTKKQQQEQIQKSTIQTEEPQQIPEEKPSKKQSKEEWTPVEETIQKETQETEIEEELIPKVEDEIQDNKHKIDAFKEIPEIDSKTAVLLYDGGYLDVKQLKDARIRDISKIRGIKRKTAKKIKDKIEEKFPELDPKIPITPGVSDEEIAADRPFEEKDIYPSPVELKTKTSEWSPVKDKEIEDINEEELITELEEEVENNQKKIDAFKDISDIDKKTAILLFDNGITNIEQLKKAELKDITKIKGIKKRLIKKIKIELEDKKKQLETEDQKEKKRLKVKKEKKKVTQKVKKTELEEEQKNETEENVQYKIEPFEKISNIDEKTAILLYDNGITSIEILHETPIKKLVKIKGIRRKIAKIIKGEIDDKLKMDQEKQKQKTRKIIDDDQLNDNSFSDYSEEDVWDSYGEEAPEDIVKDITGYRQGDYTLYKKDVKTGSGDKKRTIHFFSKGEPDDGEPVQLPKGYEVKVNKRTKVPYIKKKK